MPRVHRLQDTDWLHLSIILSVSVKTVPHALFLSDVRNKRLGQPKDDRQQKPHGFRPRASPGCKADQTEDAYLQRGYCHEPSQLRPLHGGQSFGRQHQKRRNGHYRGHRRQGQDQPGQGHDLAARLGIAAKRTAADQRQHPRLTINANQAIADHDGGQCPDQRHIDRHVAHQRQGRDVQNRICRHRPSCRLPKPSRAQIDSVDRQSGRPAKLVRDDACLNLGDSHGC